MSHVDEGALHAYLDGALDEYPATEAQRVREHLEVCATCRERLEVERGVRDAAGSILAMAAPEVDVPSFEELRAYVRANAPRQTVSLRLYRLGWAASVMLALGTGWMLRGGQRVPVITSDGARVSAPRAQESAVPVEADLREVTESERAVEAPPVEERAAGETRRAPTAARERAAVVAAPRQVTAPGPTPVDAVATDDVPPAADALRDLDAGVALASADSRLDGVVVERVDGLRAEAVTAAAPAPSPDVVVAEPVAELAQASDGARGGGTAEPGRRAAAADPVASANQAAPAAGPFGQTRTLEFGDARDRVAEDEESFSLVVPDLEVLEVRFRGLVQPEGQVVLQRLESGDTLQVIHLPPEIDPSSLEEPASGDAEVILQRSAGWIVMRAPVSEAALLELLERLLAER